jgi:hypothetical protein
LTAHLTLEDLRRWEDHGATWQALEIEEASVTLQLCTCFGEPVELARGEDPDLVGYVREHRRAAS